MTISPTDEFLTETEAASFLRVKRQTLSNWRWAHTGPKFFRIGLRMVRYRRTDLVAFVEGGKVSA